MRPLRISRRGHALSGRPRSARGSAVLLCLLCSTTAAAAAEAGDDPPRPSCRLAPAECARALHEVAVDAEAFARDAEILGLGLSPDQRARALIRRDDDRMAERLRQLPGPIADEVVRLRACQALDPAAGRGGAESPDPLCR